MRLRALNAGPSVAAGLAALAGALTLTGCQPEKEARAALAGETFKTPAPRDAKDDPAVAESASTGDAISAAIARIHERLTRLDEGYRGRERIEGDLKRVSERMRPLIESARGDCDAIHRAATDLRVQLPIVQVGYASSAASYRERARGYADPDHRAINLAIAREFDRLAGDTPRRIELTDRFIRELEEVRRYLAESERCLRDTEAALAIFSGGGRAPEVAADGRAFSRTLGQFIAVVRRYEEELLGKPEGPTTPPPPAEDPPPAGETSTLVPSPAPTRVVRVRAEAVNAAFKGPPTPRPGAAALQAGWVFRGTLSTPSHGFSTPVRLEVVERLGDRVSGVMHYGPFGRRGLEGRISGDGRRLTLRVEWWEGAISPEQMTYELAFDGRRLEGPWASASLSGSVRLDAEAWPGAILARSGR
ncbi:MAG: hypothetical protein KatS3mg108_2622 [Isosphaeraceae bacterium]|jgi:hypothetical protein|nr:MAG: hypothetical protein KatS3mg108_2622 [Isosphaeraceae bacterium]